MKKARRISRTGIAAALDGGGFFLALGCGGRVTRRRSAPPGKGGKGAPRRAAVAVRAPQAGGGPPGGGAAARRRFPVEVASRSSAARCPATLLETNGSARGGERRPDRRPDPGSHRGARGRRGHAPEEGRSSCCKIDETESFAPRSRSRRSRSKEATRAHDRATAASLESGDHFSREVYDTALAQLESAQAQLMGSADPLRVHGT